MEKRDRRRNGSARIIGRLFQRGKLADQEKREEEIEELDELMGNLDIG
jgi:hypothetical protein